MAEGVTRWTPVQLEEAAKTLQAIAHWVKEHTGPLNHRECGIRVDWDYDAPIDQWCEECQAKQSWLPAIALIQAALRTLEGQTWQPIATLPPAINEQAHQRVFVFMPDIIGDKVQVMSIANIARLNVRMTHWMPLPAPPDGPREEQA